MFALFMSDNLLIPFIVYLNSAIECRLSPLLEMMWRRNLEIFKCLVKFRNYSYLHNPGSEPLRSLTIGKLLEESAQKYGERTALVSRSQNKRFTYQEALDQADRLAAGFRTLGLNMGDRIGIWAPNIAEWYLTHMACARGGFVLVNINPAYQPMELQACINSVGVKALVCAHKFKDDNYYEHLLKLAPEIQKCQAGRLFSKALPTLETIIVPSDEELSGTFKYDDVVNLASEVEIQNIRNLQNFINPDGVCHLQFTSGTTGVPKSPQQTHFQIVNNSYSIGKRNELDKRHHTLCMLGPFFHAFGTVIVLCSAVNHGATLVLPAPGYDPDKALDAIRDEKCSVILGTPTMYVDIVNRQKIRQENINPEIAVSGGACCSPHLFREMKEILKLKKVKSVYGLTEVTAVAFQSLYDDDEYQSTSTVGYVGDHLEVKVVDEKGHTVPRGTPGELLIRGYSTTLGYWQNEEKTKELIGPDKWLRTGDQFILEENGYGKVVGRLKEMVIRGGENIFPAEVEDFLNTHPGILETHVIGVPHERLGEEVCACVRLRPGHQLTLDDLKLFCKGNLANFKIPSKLKIVESFPKTTSGKIQKYKLINNINKEINLRSKVNLPISD
ncbi:unnamed protein product [Ceutorhynchus assimilis]|uniref:Medium-chain acyl-CoA ligase ACSF2, mitochondrial n=1 Tax=Ceutorhynchus assimilis TaxID=467358 RepID=A0A9N9QMP1_9CUCU|nr:unnamed protein product [Ceutorhynchus assimilis]